ncbi:MAG: hypothetical protein JNJ54_36455 [Myxococcaceae bacterium]|nr:hypothetical protein [Myxococcaceae bacterium]
MRAQLASLEVLGLLGCSSASLSELRPGLSSNGFQCWLTLAFRQPPKSGDVQDVRVVFSSVVLLQDESFDWEYLTTHDHTVSAEKDWAGTEQRRFVADETTTPETTPAGKTLQVLFQLPAPKTVEVKPGDETNLTARLFWAGKERDSISRGLFMAYQRQ